jgi:hypothetical protein
MLSGALAKKADKNANIIFIVKIDNFWDILFYNLI